MRTHGKQDASLTGCLDFATLSLASIARRRGFFLFSLASAFFPLLPQTHVGRDFLAHASIFIGFALALAHIRYGVAIIHNC